ncbi:MAG: hypothetical protein LW685_08580 [Algoriphagus sp.]|nr:hypothetical protein [Algoriphagus sp.]
MKKSILLFALMFTSFLVNCQSLPTFLGEGVTSFFTRQDDNWGSSQRIVLYRNGQSIIGFAGWSAQSEFPGYLKGQLDGNTITGTLFTFYGEEEPISITLEQNSISTNWGYPFTEDGAPLKMPVETEELFAYKTITVYEEPNFASKILAQDLEAENKGFMITEIGKMDKNPEYPEESNIWYKVKNSEVDGWVYGLINAL